MEMRSSPLAADEDNFVADLHIRNVGDIDHALVHADAADDLAALAVNEHFCVVAHHAHPAVGVADRERCDDVAFFGGVGAAVADAFASVFFFDIGDARLEREHWFYVDVLVLRFVARVDAVEDNAWAYHIEEIFRMVDDDGAVADVADLWCEAAFSETVEEEVVAFPLQMGVGLVGVVGFCEVGEEPGEFYVRQFQDPLRSCRGFLLLAGNRCGPCRCRT